MPTFAPTSEYSSNVIGEALCGVAIPGAGDIATTSVEYFDLEYWQRDPNIETVYLPDTPGGTPVPHSITASRTPWAFEVRDSANVFVDDVANWLKLGPLKMTVDEASSVSFSVKHDNANISDLAPPNRIWLRDRYGFYVATFTIMETPSHRNMDEIFVDIICEDALIQLAREPIVHFITEEQSLITTVKELLDEQVQSPPLILGQMDPAIAEYQIAFEGNDTSILGALRTLQSEMPKNQRGYFFVDSGNRLQWRSKIGRDAGETLTVGEGLNGHRFSVNYRDLTNRVLAYGRGKDHRTRVKLTDPGADQANEWVDSASSIATYGLYPMLKVDRRFKHPESLLAFSLRVLEEFDTPELSIDIREVIDVAKADEPSAGARFPGVNDLYHGSRYRVVDAGLSIDTSVFVRTIEYDLENPLPVRIQATNKRRTMADAISYLLNQLAEPLDVMDDGTRYPKIGRLLTGTESAEDFPDLVNRNGDWRYNSGVMEFWNDDEWVPVGANVHQSETFAGLPALTAGDHGALGSVSNDGDLNGAYTWNGTEWLRTVRHWLTKDTDAVPGDLATVGEKGYHKVTTSGGDDTDYVGTTDVIPP